MSNNDELKELLQLLESSKKRTLEEPKGSEFYSVRKFIKELNIKAGTKRIHNYIVYYYYREKFPQVDRKVKLKKIRFFQLFSKYFEKARVGKQRYYLLDPSSFDLTREGKLEAKQYDQEYKKMSKTWRETQKKKREISRIKQTNESEI